jgi:hypothetical protein
MNLGDCGRRIRDNCCESHENYREDIVVKGQRYYRKKVFPVSG